MAGSPVCRLAAPRSGYAARAAPPRRLAAQAALGADDADRRRARRYGIDMSRRHRRATPTRRRRRRAVGSTVACRPPSPVAAPPRLGPSHSTWLDPDAVRRRTRERGLRCRVLVQPMSRPGALCVELREDPAWGRWSGSGWVAFATECSATGLAGGPLTDRDAAALVDEPRAAPCCAAPGFRPVTGGLADLCCGWGSSPTNSLGLRSLTLNPVLPRGRSRCCTRQCASGRSAPAPTPPTSPLNLAFVVRRGRDLLPAQCLPSDREVD